jgi:S-DNA-T family DNA segregation ATPase FtsK/SpoIIIE
VRRVEDKTRVKVDSIVAREKDLAMALAAPSLRIEAPIPGASMVGIEVPNPRPAVVALRAVMETNVFQALHSRSKLALGLGMGTGGEIAAADLARMPHLLIAGSTGSGKSVCINSVIACIIMYNSPWETRMLLIDPKRVELTPYNGIPHLLVPVVVEVEVAVQVLKGMIQEMQRRYKVFEEAGARNIEGYNRGRPPQERMPLVVIAVDELADLMMSAPYDIERSIIRLSQLGRATGIHLVVATQRPSVDVITGLIKANFPSRISFAVASQVDSRTILDSVGAEKLLGRGDMLFQPQDAPKPRRIQGAFVSDKEIDDLVGYWRKQQGPLPPDIPLDFEESDQATRQQDGELGDELLGKAWDLASQYHRLSTSLLQRRLRIGYPRAARLMDLLEEEGVVGPGEAGKSREVLVARSKTRGQDD